ncbi:MAG: hypothetical protein H7A23_04570 [Leptospiraceae bacterium]|nr:hypothetical protein [Leptospiraceae bacterium]MCP5493808.1 hypothetical protein [Leptospiraceae bacterium]
MRKYFLVSLFFLFIGNVFAVDIKVFLKNKSIIVGDAGNEALEIKSDYGNLKIPIKAINTIIIGKKSSKDLKKEFAVHIRNLRSSDEKIRSKAEQEILDMGVYILDDLEELQEKDVYLAPILQDIIDQNYANEENASLIGKIQENDTIMTRDMHFTGDITNPTFNLKTPFGNLKIYKKDIFKINILNDADVSVIKRKSVTVPATAIAINGFVDTSIKVKKGDKLTIVATGTINLASLSGGSFTPDGNSSMGNWQNIPFGALCGKIGDHTPFFIGKSLSITATESGPLKLAISESVYNAGNSGSYKVRITFNQAR